MEPAARPLPARPRARLIVLAAAIAVVLAGCSLVPGSPSPRDLALRLLAERQAQWFAKGVDDYAFTVSRQCFCPSTEPFVVTVSDGVTIGITRAGKPAAAIELQGIPTSIPALFAIVTANAQAGDMTVEWEPTFGFPTAIQVDPIPNAIDDEFGITVTDFRPAS